MRLSMPLGGLWVDLEGLTLETAERKRLLHPAVGGVILFARNFQHSAQLQALVAEIDDLRDPALPVAVDQEGGTVQRFREGFTPLPSARRLGILYDANPQLARDMAQALGLVLASELQICGIAFSFMPVLDIHNPDSKVIGERAMHPNPQVIVDLALPLIGAMQSLGMGVVGKHFPGHGGVSGDSHRLLPVDDRNWQEVHDRDLHPFHQLSLKLDAVMTAHIHYSAISEQIPTYSRFWIEEVLRQRLAFPGLVFSDDLSMEGAVIGSLAKRIDLASRAGCDALLLCNIPRQVDTYLAGECPLPDPASQLRIDRFQALTRQNKPRLSASELDAARNLLLTLAAG